MTLIIGGRAQGKRAYALSQTGLSLIHISIRTEATALEVVVLPIPISPVARISYPSRLSFSASEAPNKSASSACALVIALSLIHICIHASDVVFAAHPHKGAACQA